METADKIKPEEIKEFVSQLLKFLKSEPRNSVRHNKEIAEVVGIDPSYISRAKKFDPNANDRGETEVYKTVEKIVATYGLVWQQKDSDGTLVKKYQFIQEKFPQFPATSMRRSVNMEESRHFLPDEFVGIWQGYFMRSSEAKVVSILMYVSKDGTARYRTEWVKTLANESRGTLKFDDKRKIIFAEFTRTENAIFNFVFHPLKDKTRLEGLYAGASNFVNWFPTGGMIRLDKFKPTKPEQIDWEMLFEQKASELKSYSLSEREELRALLRQSPDIIDFFLGSPPQTHLQTETVGSWQAMKMVPYFELKTEGLQGTFLLYRLTSDRNALLLRAVRIYRDARVEMRISRKNREGDTDIYRYWGRLHFFPMGNIISISIDRRSINNRLDESHRSNYIFKHQGTTDYKNIDILYGLSTITNHANEPRVGHEALVPADEYLFENVEQANGSFVKDNYAELTIKEKKIFDYLRSKPIDLIPNRQRLAIVEEFNKMGDVYFELACYRAQDGKTTTALEALELAILHGFTNEVKWNVELAAGGSFASFADLVQYHFDCGNRIVLNTTKPSKTEV